MAKFFILLMYVYNRAQRQVGDLLHDGLTDIKNRSHWDYTGIYQILMRYMIVHCANILCIIYVYCIAIWLINRWFQFTSIYFRTLFRVARSAARTTWSWRDWRHAWPSSKRWVSTSIFSSPIDTRKFYLWLQYLSDFQNFTCFAFTIKHLLWFSSIAKFVRENQKALKHLYDIWHLGK